MKIYLLTHQRELNRNTNTGSIALKSSSGLVQRVLWDRVKPNKMLLELIESNAVVLLYPSPESKCLTVAEFENIIILDATWQEAQKMYNKSPYLKNINQAQLTRKETSEYNLRRNQPEGGLCTIECVIEVLRVKGMTEIADELQAEFIKINV